jgi:monoamine oxidase
MESQENYDVIVIGAGAAGLMAAWELVQTGKKVAIIEARDRIGGRIHTVYDQNFSLPIEAGAEFVHGDLPLTTLLLKKAGIAYPKVEGSNWRREKNGLQKTDFIEGYRELNKKFKELKTDIYVGDFISQYLNEPKYERLIQSLKSYVEGYYAADLGKASTFALRDELNNSSDEQYRVESGYQTLVNFFYSEFLQKRGTVYFSSPVTTIDWQRDDIKIITAQQTLIAKKIIITVPIGVLQSEIIKFSPAIENKIDVIKQAGYGAVIKTILLFERPFWTVKALTGKDTKKMTFLFSEESVPTWWTQYPKEVAMLTGWLGGPHAEKMKHLSESEMLENAITSLSSIFNMEPLLYIKNYKVGK